MEALRAVRAQGRVTWANVAGLGDTQLIEEIAEVSGSHPLVVGNVLNLQADRMPAWKAQGLITSHDAER